MKILSSDLEQKKWSISWTIWFAFHGTLDFRYLPPYDATTLTSGRLIEINYTLFNRV